MIFSNPHFLDADPEYLDGVEGLKPVEDKHKTFVLMEPVRPLSFAITDKMDVDVN